MFDKVITIILSSIGDSQDSHNADLTLSQSTFYKVYVSVYTYITCR